MPSEYRLQLESKLDSVNRLERSGYGATYGRELRREDGESMKSAVAMLVAVLAWAVLVTVLSV
jgi:hypothetical protein